MSVGFFVRGAFDPCGILFQFFFQVAARVEKAYLYPGEFASRVCGAPNPDSLTPLNRRRAMQGLSPDTCAYEASQGYYTTLHSFAAVLRIMIDEHEHEHDDEQADAYVARVARRLGNAQMAKLDDRRYAACPMAWLGYYVTRPRADVDVTTSYLFERAGPGAVNVSWDDIVQRQQPANMENDGKSQGRMEQKPVSAGQIRAWVKEFASKYELVRYDAGLGAAVVRHTGGGFGRQLCTVRCCPREMTIDLAKLDSPRMRLALDWARTSRLSVIKLALVRGVALQLDANRLDQPQQRQCD